MCTEEEMDKTLLKLKNEQKQEYKKKEELMQKSYDASVKALARLGMSPLPTRV